ncbi:uncharacterized protein BDW47DRAFT_109866 [Aspergillus candidus]|uniref:Uncharacterized protein n=1 Tax=Aspergillus candidus TaxID=41067 RepID=A0A2I2F582_ASPCN|nr:hypothetical protein BDW47DRAFT_109866 [Aspergillus candidus]PLB35810.1 hypothetical protein BDW47DRAFT_109866 [Aspergillus candidus]
MGRREDRREDLFYAITATALRAATTVLVLGLTLGLRAFGNDLIQAAVHFGHVRGDMWSEV